MFSWFKKLGIIILVFFIFAGIANMALAEECADPPCGSGSIGAVGGGVSGGGGGGSESGNNNSDNSNSGNGGDPAIPAVPATPAVPGVSPAIPATPSHSGGSRPATSAVPVNQVLGAQTGPIPGCGNRTTGFSVATGESCIGNSIGQVLGAEKFNFTKFLKFKAGSYKVSLQGAEVIELQKFLTTLGYDLGIADGKFGPMTEGAVIKFQISKGLKGDGIVGALTRAVLNK